MRVAPGKPYPLGATWDGEGVNFAIFSENATGVELCLFDSPGPDAGVQQFALTERTAHIWHGYIRGLQAGQLYGYRVHGPFSPEEGQRFNPSKLAIDPYARALAGKVNWEAPVFGYPLGDKKEDLAMDERDDAWGVPKAVVVNPFFDWGDDRPPRTVWKDTVIYETHVRGLTCLHPEVDEELRGSYAGLASPPIVNYLKKLGVTSIELMPVHAFLNDKMLLDKGLSNYWGYNTIGFFAPEARYSSMGDLGQQVNEFKAMVKALHAAGLEVILDVVYNHTAEGNHLGPTLTLKAIDNASYYRLMADQPRYYMDYTGTGNSLNMRHPETLKLIMDSLRYWVQEMHVDGFRFDLASTLARELHDVDRLSAFFDIIHQDPVISRVKLIAEPWDVGEGGYQVGNFPVLWTEWNGLYRDTVRGFWKGDEIGIGSMAYRITGSSDLYQSDGRHPYASINLITAHDGFTLNDLVSYNDKHNEANGEDSRDGHDNNLSWNCGVEGPTDDPGVLALREKQKRNFLATLFLSQGVPMLLGGDEMGRTQQGNNNAYCQDNEISWYHWDLSEPNKQLLEFTAKLIRLRAEHPSLGRQKFFQGRRLHGSKIEDVVWLKPDGEEMGEQDWEKPFSQLFGFVLAGDALDEYDANGERLVDDTLLILLNADYQPVQFVLPKLTKKQGSWEVILDTSRADDAEGAAHPMAKPYDLADRSLALFRLKGENPG